jgi:hypothetical protein
VRVAVVVRRGNRQSVCFWTRFGCCALHFEPSSACDVVVVGDNRHFGLWTRRKGGNRTPKAEAEADHSEGCEAVISAVCTLSESLWLSARQQKKALKKPANSQQMRLI